MALQADLDPMQCHWGVFRNVAHIKTSDNLLYMYRTRLIQRTEKDECIRCWRLHKRSSSTPTVSIQAQPLTSYFHHVYSSANARLPPPMYPFEPEHSPSASTISIRAQMLVSHLQCTHSSPNACHPPPCLFEHKCSSATSTISVTRVDRLTLRSMILTLREVLTKRHCVLKARLEWWTRDEGQAHNQTDCGFVRLTLWLRRTRMRKRVQAGQVFKYYRLPKWKVIELYGR